MWKASYLSRVWVKQAQVDQGLYRAQQLCRPECPDRTLTYTHSWTLLILWVVLGISAEGTDLKSVGSFSLSLQLFAPNWLQGCFYKTFSIRMFWWHNSFLKRETVHNFKGVIRGPTLFFYLYYKTPLFCYHDFLKENSFSLSKKLFIFYSFFFRLIFISWRLITLQYCSGFCHTLTWISHGFTCIPHPYPPSHLPLHPSPLGLPSAPGPSILSHASSLGWWSVSPEIIYMFRCCSLETSHPRLLPQSLKDCSINLCLFFCSAYSYH